MMKMMWIMMRSTNTITTPRHGALLGTRCIAGAIMQCPQFIIKMLDTTATIHGTILMLGLRIEEVFSFCS